MRNIQRMLSVIAMMLPLAALTGCEGAFDWVYDDPEPIRPAQGQLYYDFSDWKKWYYIDIPAISDSTRSNPAYDAAASIVAYPIPMDATGEVEYETGHHRNGQYMYWYDIFGEGLTRSEFTHFTPTAGQPEPDSWTIAIHRDNVRTNGGAVCELDITDFDAIPPVDVISGMPFTPDEWSENEVWDDQAQMLMCYVPSQGIYLNKLLSSWLVMSLPPIPPSFAHNKHIYIVRLRDNTYAALQLIDYMSETGTKCCLTIKYKYPL